MPLAPDWFESHLIPHPSAHHERDRRWWEWCIEKVRRWEGKKGWEWGESDG